MDWVIKNYIWAPGYMSLRVVVFNENEHCKIVSEEFDITNPTQKITFKEIIFLTRMMATNEHEFYREVYCTQQGCNFKVKASDVDRDFRKALTHKCSRRWEVLNVELTVKDDSNEHS